MFCQRNLLGKLLALMIMKNVLCFYVHRDVVALAVNSGHAEYLAAASYRRIRITNKRITDVETLGLVERYCR